MILNSKS